MQIPDSPVPVRLPSNLIDLPAKAARAVLRCLHYLADLFKPGREKYVYGGKRKDDSRSTSWRDSLASVSPKIRWKRFAAHCAICLITLLGPAFPCFAADNVARYHKQNQLSPEVETLLADGQSGLMTRNWSSAEEALTKAIRLDPLCYDCYQKLAQVHLGSRQYERAAQDFSTLIALEPEIKEVFYVDRARAYLNVHKYDRAIGDCNKALALRGSYADGYVIRGAAQCKTGHYARALADFSKALMLKPGHREALYFRGECEAYHKDFKDAIADLQAAEVAYRDAGRDYSSNWISNLVSDLKAGDLKRFDQRIHRSN